jgi:hypothetical protein
MRVLIRSLTVGGLAALALAWAEPASAQMEGLKAVSHDVAGREQCLMCHTAGRMEPVPDAPASHEGRTDAQCLWCHATDSPMLTMTPPAIAHAVDGREQCLMCHTAGRMEPVPDVPASHEGREDATCRMCHMPAGG